MSAEVQIQTRKPTGRPTWPFILVHGPEKTGKSWLAAQLTTTGRFSRCFYVDWGLEGAADDFAILPGADYEIVLHDGTFDSVAAQVKAIHAFAEEQAAKGEKPVLLVIDGLSEAWDQLKLEAEALARDTKANRERLARDPNYEITIPQPVWTKIHAKARRFHKDLVTINGVAVGTAKGEEVTEVGKNGHPTGNKIYKIQCHKDVPFAASVVLELSRTAPPMITGMRHPLSGIRPGIDPAYKLGERPLEELIWGRLFKNRSEPATRDLMVAIDGPHLPTPNEYLDMAAQPETTADQVLEWFREAEARGLLEEEVTVENRTRQLGEALTARGKALRQAEAGDGIAVRAASAAATPAAAQSSSQAEPPEQDSARKWHDALQRAAGDIERLSVLRASAVEKNLTQRFIQCIDDEIAKCSTEEAPAEPQDGGSATQAADALVNEGSTNYITAVKIVLDGAEDDPTEADEQFGVLAREAEDAGPQHLQALIEGLQTYGGQENRIQMIRRRWTHLTAQQGAVV